MDDDDDDDDDGDGDDDDDDDDGGDDDGGDDDDGDDGDDEKYQDAKCELFNHKNNCHNAQNNCIPELLKLCDQKCQGTVKALKSLRLFQPPSPQQQRQCDPAGNDMQCLCKKDGSDM